MEHVTFTPKGVCSIQIDFDLEDGKLYNVQFIGGCNGNLKAIGRLVEGKDAKDPAEGGNGGSEDGNGGSEGGNGGDPDKSAIHTSLHMETPVRSSYDVFDVNGVRIGRMSAYSMSEAVEILKSTSDIKVQGIYLLRSVKNGAVKSVRVAR